MAAWGYKYLPVSEELGIRARLLSEGGPKLWAEFMDELRENHLGVKRRKRTGPSVGERLQAAYESVVNENSEPRGIRAPLAMLAQRAGVRRRYP